ncbi:YdcF family protein [Carboxylicivirga sp. RSCT41]|uniref:YdcF family protein n=1 Tax=Carboxylicivirga agarovorans TaxID=3417570 RepID=UPI003D3582B0
MFFLLSKILSFLLIPFNWCVLLLVLTLFIKSRSVKKLSFISAALIFLFFSNSYIFQKITKAWEYPAHSLQDQQYSVKPLVLLGGLSDYEDAIQRIHFYEASDRLLQTILLHNMNKERPIVISGGSAEIYFTERPEADYLQEYLINIGIDSSKIHFEQQSRNTFENALYSAALFDSLYLKKDIALITSAFHMKRAKACFEKQGFKVDAISTHLISSHQPLKPADYFLPSLTTLQLWPLLLKEWMGILVYKIKHYI